MSEKGVRILIHLRVTETYHKQLSHKQDRIY